jgi:signal recognition particle subunit SRP54
MGQMREQIENIDEREIDRVSAIIKSMTPVERRDPKILNGSRRSRIAAGSGTKVSDVNGLVDRFGEAQKMMRQMVAGGGMPNLPGMPGMPGMGGKRAKAKQAAPKKGKKARSGNPAKRAIEEQRIAQRGTGGDGGAALPPDVELPPEFEGLRDLLPPGSR